MRQTDLPPEGWEPENAEEKNAKIYEIASLFATYDCSRLIADHPELAADHDYFTPFGPAWRVQCSRRLASFGLARDDGGQPLPQHIERALGQISWLDVPAAKPAE